MFAWLSDEEETLCLETKYWLSLFEYRKSFSTRGKTEFLLLSCLPTETETEKKVKNVLKFVFFKE